jgi:hypothetical protein
MTTLRFLVTIGLAPASSLIGVFKCLLQVITDDVKNEYRSYQT